MRDKKRIPVICDKLAKVWSKVPDWRLAQLFVNCISQDPFYMEDEAFVKMLDENLDKMIKGD